MRDQSKFLRIVFRFFFCFTLALLHATSKNKTNARFIFARLNLDVTWSETGDRYMLKLFRDYLFHTVTDSGQPWLDHAHIIQCLNKLDAGTMEKVFLRSHFD